MNDQRQTVRDAALLIASLEQNLADRLLDRLSPAETDRLRRAVTRLGAVEPDERQTLVVQFRRARDGIGRTLDGGVVLEGVLADHGTASVSPPPAPQARPFRFLSGADPQSLVPFLTREHGQTTALVLSHLPAEQAAEVLAALPAAMQVDVVQRLASLDTADEESLQVVARELETWMDEQRQHGQRRAAGIQAVSGILAAASPTQQQEVIANLRAANQDLARQVTQDVAHATNTGTARTDTPYPVAPPRRNVQPKPQTIAFEDLRQLDGERLAALTAAAEPEIVVLALAGASDRLTTRLLDALPPQQADQIRSQLAQPGPIRLSDVEAAQRELTRLAMTLDDQHPTGRQTATIAA